jgi:glutamine amidotransferase
MDVVVLDYGAGNLTSVLKALRALGVCASTSEDPAALSVANAIIIPGVGHFDRTKVITVEQRAAIRSALARPVPVLGICLGLQWLFEGSDEAPDVEGLGIFRGRCFDLGTRSRRASARREIKIPHVGWNTLARTSRPSRLLMDVGPDTFAYFTHSFAAPVVDETTATTEHASEFSAVVENGRVFGVQFHPEKSGKAGLSILTNFLATAAVR